MKKTPSEILHSIIDATSITVKDFANGLGESYTRIFSIYCGRTKTISNSLIDKIVEKYGVERRFLTTGEGSIFSEPQHTTKDELVTGLFAIVDGLRAENEGLKKRVKELEEELSKLR